jgi:hypothetical protein
MRLKIRVKGTVTICFDMLVSENHNYKRICVFPLRTYALYSPVACLCQVSPTSSCNLQDNQTVFLQSTPPLPRCVSALTTRSRQGLFCATAVPATVCRGSATFCCLPTQLAAQQLPNTPLDHRIAHEHAHALTASSSQTYLHNLHTPLFAGQHVMEPRFYNAYGL